MIEEIRINSEDKPMKHLLFILLVSMAGAASAQSAGEHHLVAPVEGKGTIKNGVWTES